PGRAGLSRTEMPFELGLKAANSLQEEAGPARIEAIVLAALLNEAEEVSDLCKGVRAGRGARTGGHGVALGVPKERSGVLGDHGFVTDGGVTQGHAVVAMAEQTHDGD